MRVTLLHNPKAGGDSAASKEELLGWLERAGMEAVYVNAKKDDLDEALADPGALVVAAGGDGTIAKVARRLAGRGIPMSILPFGTANNIASTLEIEGDAESLVEALGAVPLGDAPRRRLDVGVARARWGERRFVEGAGTGLIAALLATDEREEKATKDHSDDPERRIELGLELLLRTAGEMEARRWRLTADGQSFDGDYVMVEAFNIRSLGPRVRLAPDADPGDGKLDLVLVRESGRAALVEYLERLLAGESPEPPVRARRVHTVRITGEREWFEHDFHLDDKRWKIEEEGDGESEDRRAPAVELSCLLAVEVLGAG